MKTIRKPFPLPNRLMPRAARNGTGHQKVRGRRDVALGAVGALCSAVPPLELLALVTLILVGRY